MNEEVKRKIEGYMEDIGESEASKELGKFINFVELKEELDKLKKREIEIENELFQIKKRKEMVVNKLL